MPSITFGIIFNLLNFVMASSRCVHSKIGLLFMIIVSISEVTTLITFYFPLINFNTRDDGIIPNQLFLPVLLYLLICVSPVMYYIMILLYLSCMKCILRCRVGHNLKYIPVLSSLLYFVAFIFIIAYLAPPDSARLD